MIKRYFLIVLSLVGLIDASFLTYEHYSSSIPPCSQSIVFSDCGKVLNSTYATVFGIPLAVIGVIHYSIILFLSVWAFLRREKFPVFGIIIELTGGFLASCYFVFVQLFILHAICLYCMFSAIVTTLLFILSLGTFKKERKLFVLFLMHILYVYCIKRFLFLFPPESVHVLMVRLGETVGSASVVRYLLSFLIFEKDPRLTQVLEGISFVSPVGLAAGFDYEGRLSEALMPWGFGFQTVGTLTNEAYKGNPAPLLGRLPRSHSLMVNKGFKNLGVKETLKRLKNKKFLVLLGISIGRTNSLLLKTQRESIKDICSAFLEVEKHHIPHAYYELNISCPNLMGDITFYPPQNLDDLLTAVDKLKLKKALFIKMPIEKSNKEVFEMLAVIAKHSVSGVIIGNLQKDRKNKNLVPSEVAQFPVGNFSGKPTFDRSNELIKLCYSHYGKKLLIIGCGGIFSAEDAYKKIQLGASLVQLITGMIYEGPNLIMSINMGLLDLLHRDGFSHISEAVGSKNR